MHVALGSMICVCKCVCVCVSDMSDDHEFLLTMKLDSKEEQNKPCGEEKKSFEISTRREILHAFMINEVETFYRVNKLREISTESLLNEMTWGVAGGGEVF